MKTQRLILIGILSFWTGWICDGLLFPYFFILIYIGTIISLFGTGKWMLVKENRMKLKESLGVGQRGIFLKIRTAFDFSWKRTSIIWSLISLIGMALIHGINTIFKTSDAYKEAKKYVESNNHVLAKSGGILHIADNTSGKIGSENEIFIGVIGREESFYTTVYLDYDRDIENYIVRDVKFH